MASPVLTVDVLIEYPDGSLVFIQRKNEPFQGMWALPGGLVEVGETVEEAAMREAKEETGLDVLLVDLVGVYSDPGRDPRGHFVSVTFHARPVSGELAAATDAASVLKTNDLEELELAFDHDVILGNFLEHRGER